MQSLIQKLESVRLSDLFREAKIRVHSKHDYTSNDYLSLGNSIRARFWLLYSVLFYGKSLCASKYLSGYSRIHQKLEQTVAKHYGCESSLIFSSGYLASIGILQGLCDSNTIVVADKHIHASWIDGVFTVGAKLKRFSHNNLGHLSEILKEHREKRIVILTETVFSMHGTVVDVEKYTALAQEFNAFLITDNAHGLGVITLPKTNYSLHIQMGTFSKSCAGFGGYVAANKTIIQAIANFGRTQIYSTSIPEYLLSYNIFAFNFVCKQSGGVLSKAKEIGEKFGLEYKGSAILTKEFSSIEDARSFQKSLQNSGVLCSVVRPPTVQKPIIRLCVHL